MMLLLHSQVINNTDKCEPNTQKSLEKNSPISEFWRFTDRLKRSKDFVSAPKISIYVLSHYLPRGSFKEISYNFCCFEPSIWD